MAYKYTGPQRGPSAREQAIADLKARQRQEESTTDIDVDIPEVSGAAPSAPSAQAAAAPDAPFDVDVQPDQQQRQDAVSSLRARMASKGVAPAQPEQQAAQEPVFAQPDQRLQQLAATRQGQLESGQLETVPQMGQVPDTPLSGTAVQRQQEFQQGVSPTGPSFLHQQAQRKATESKKLAATQPYKQEVMRLENIKRSNPDMSDAERSQLDDQIAEQQVRIEAINNEFKKQAEQFGVTPVADKSYGDLQDRIDRDRRRMYQLNSDAALYKDVSGSAKALYDYKFTVIEPLLGDAPLLGVTQSSGQHESILDYLEDISGIQDASFHANNLALAVAQAALGGRISNDNSPDQKAESLADLDYDMGLVDLGDFFEEKNSPTYDPKAPDDERLRQLPEYEALAELLGNIFKNQLNRQGGTIMESPVVLGQNLLLALNNAGQVKFIPYTQPATGIRQTKVAFKPDHLIDIAAAASVIFPKILKDNPTIQGGLDGTWGYEGAVGEVVEKMTAGMKGKTPVSNDAVEAAIHTEQNMRTVHGPEMSMYAYATLKAKEDPQSAAAKVLQATKVDTQNAQGITPAEQNLGEVDRHLQYAANKLGVPYTQRVKIGTNSSRKYPTTNLNPTYYKDVRGYERAAPNAVPRFIPGQVNVGTLPRNEMELKTKVESWLRNINATPEMALKEDVGHQLPKELREMQFFHTVGTILSDNVEAPLNPTVAMREAIDNLSDWGLRGQPLLQLLGDVNNIPALVEARKNAKSFTMPDQLPQGVPEIFDAIMAESNPETAGYKMSALLDSALYIAVRNHNNNNPNSPIEFVSPSVLQYDLSSAGTSTVAKDGLAASILESVGLITELDADGNVIAYASPRRNYMRAGIGSLGSIYHKHYDDLGKDIANQVEALFKEFANDPKHGDEFVEKWGKTPIMTTSYSKHEKTHGDFVGNLLEKPQFTQFKNRLVRIYEQYGITDYRMLIDDMATVHEKSLKNLFTKEELEGIGVLKKAMHVANINNEPLSVEIFGQQMVYGVEKNEIEGWFEQDGAYIPVFSGERSFDSMGRPTEKVIKRWNKDGTTSNEHIVGNMGAATTNPILASWGHKRESMLLDGTINAIQNQVKGAYFGNFYDGISADANSSLLTWYHMNYNMPVKVMKENPRKAFFEAANKQAVELQKKVRDLKGPIDAGYPNGEWGALGYDIDDTYRRLVEAIENAEIQGKNLSQANSVLLNTFDKLEADGWTPPSIISDPNQEEWQVKRGWKRMKLAVQQRSNYEMTPRQAQIAVQAYLFANGWNPTNDYKHKQLKGWVTQGVHGRVTHDNILKQIKSGVTRWATAK